MGKKTIKDMSSDWHKAHTAKGSGIAESDFCRAVKIQSPMATPEAIERADVNVGEMGVVVDLVKDLVEDVQTIMNAPNMPVAKQEVMRRLLPYVEKAYQDLCKASKVNQGVDPDFDEDAMPTDDDEDGEMA